MTEMGISVEALVARYELVLEERMRDLPIVNPVMKVEAVGFREYQSSLLGVLITPWFMNLVLLPATTQWSDEAQGKVVIFDFPCGPVEFTVCVDDELGTFLSAILFRSVTDMPDQATAQDIAAQVMNDIFVQKERDRAISRRALFTGSKAS